MCLNVFKQKIAASLEIMSIHLLRSRTFQVCPHSDGSRISV